VRSLPIFFVSCLFVAAGLTPAAASDTAHATVTVTARFDTRTSLTVSTRVLHFDVQDPAQSATEVVDVQAAARTIAGGEVVLSVESPVAAYGPGPSDVETALSFEGHGNGLISGVLDSTSPRIAGRWIGSGKRTGQLVFALRASEAGRYARPVRFVLSAP
jgi:hypothetical protein